MAEVVFFSIQEPGERMSCGASRIFPIFRAIALRTRERSLVEAGAER